MRYNLATAKFFLSSNVLFGVSPWNLNQQLSGSLRCLYFVSLVDILIVLNGNTALHRQFLSLVYDMDVDALCSIFVKTKRLQSSKCVCLITLISFTWPPWLEHFIVLVLVEVADLF
jgi:hypothetical protein